MVGAGEHRARERAEVGAVAVLAGDGEDRAKRFVGCAHFVEELFDARLPFVVDVEPVTVIVSLVLVSVVTSEVEGPEVVRITGLSRGVGKV